MKVFIIGGGAAGVLHALYLNKLNNKFDITIIEKNDRILKKIMKTGNGRCNISNLDMSAKYYNDYNFIDNLYRKVKPQEVLEYFKSIGLILRDDSSTRLYPYSNSAKTVIDALRFELERTNVKIKLEEEVIAINKEVKYEIVTTKSKYSANYIVIASGSIAQEKTRMYDILSKLGHSITNLRPGLVPLKVKEDIRSLQGIRIKCNAKVFNDSKIVHEEAGEILFKPDGLSGVLVLNLSRFVQDNSEVSLDLFYDFEDIEKYIRSFLDKKDILEVLSSLLPKMLAQYITKLTNSFEEVIKIVRDLRFKITGDYGYNIGQIVIGGLNVNEVSEDFESIYLPNIYIIGEVLNIDGASGGYNLHFAWSSAIYSAKSIFEKNL